MWLQNNWEISELIILKRKRKKVKENSTFFKERARKKKKRRFKSKKNRYQKRLSANSFPNNRLKNNRVRSNLNLIFHPIFKMQEVGSKVLSWNKCPRMDLFLYLSLLIIFHKILINSIAQCKFHLPTSSTAL